MVGLCVCWDGVGRFVEPSIERLSGIGVQSTSARLVREVVGEVFREDWCESGVASKASGLVVIAWRRGMRLSTVEFLTREEERASEGCEAVMAKGIGRSYT